MYLDCAPCIWSHTLTSLVIVFGFVEIPNLWHLVVEFLSPPIQDCNNINVLVYLLILKMFEEPIFFVNNHNSQNI
jgi:hypothetical protein